MSGRRKNVILDSDEGKLFKRKRENTQSSAHSSLALTSSFLHLIPPSRKSTEDVVVAVKQPEPDDGADDIVIMEEEWNPDAALSRPSPTPPPSSDRDGPKKILIQSTTAKEDEVDAIIVDVRDESFLPMENLEN